MSETSPVVSFNIRGRAFGLGWLIALVVFILCIVFFATGKGGVNQTWLIAALALAFLLG